MGERDMEVKLLPLKDIKYIKGINNVIEEEIIRYAVPIYNRSNLLKNKIRFTIDDDLFLETLLLKIRGQTIKFPLNIKET